jgi:hypothetical protein
MSTLDLATFFAGLDGATVYTNEDDNETDFVIVVSWEGGAMLKAWSISDAGIHNVDVRTDYAITNDPDAAAGAALVFLDDLWNLDPASETDGWDV